MIIKVKQVALATTIGLAGAMLLTSAKANADTITIQSGDTVWGLSQKYDVSMGEIIQANYLQNPNLIYAGDSLYIPTSAAKSASSVARTPVSANSAIASQASATSSATSQAPAMTSASAVISSSTSASANATSATNTTSATTTTSANSISSSAANSSATSDNSANNVLSTNSVALQTNSSLSAASSTTTATSTSTPVASSAATSSATTSTVSSSATTSATSSTTTSASTSTNGLTTYSASEAVARAQSVIGTPYVYGGNTTSGFDCSGLVQWSYGLSSSYRTTYQQQALGTHHYDIANAPAGAIYFWGSDSAPYHDAIALGNGSYIAAPDVGQTVKTETISEFTPSYYVVIGE